MKKILVVILTISFIFALSGCGGNKDKEAINLFKEKLNSAMPNYSQQSKILAENDLAFINEYLNNH